jgi:hypothetical protein
MIIHVETPINLDHHGQNAAVLPVTWKRDQSTGKWCVHSDRIAILFSFRDHRVADQQRRMKFIRTDTNICAVRGLVWFVG